MSIKFLACLCKRPIFHGEGTGSRRERCVFEMCRSDFGCLHRNTKVWFLPRTTRPTVDKVLCACLSKSLHALLGV